MRLLRLDGGHHGPTVDLHPFFTVIRGLSGPARQQVLDALTALPAGSDPGLGGMLEAHGVLLDLERDTLQLLDLRSDIDVLVRHTDLPMPGQVPEAVATQAPPGADDGDARRSAEEAHETYAALRDGLDRLHDERQRLSDDVAKASAALEAARSELDPFAAGALDQAVQELTAQEQQLAQELGVGDAVAPAAPSSNDDLVRLQTRRVELSRALEALAGIDVQPVADAMATVRAAEGVELVPHPEALAMADVLAAAQQALEQYDAQLETQGLGPIGAQRRVEELRLHVARLEQAARPKVAGAEDVAALEAAHEAVVEAEERARGRLAGKGAQRRLEELQAEEEAILQRLGFASYTSFSFSAAAPEVDVEARVALQDAKAQLSLAERNAEEVLRMVEHDPQRQQLVEHQYALRGQALPLVGGDDRGDLEGALRALRIRPSTPVDVVPIDEAAGRLRAALEQQGVAFGDRQLGAAEVAEVAAVWLAEMEDSTNTNRTRIQQEIAQIDTAIGQSTHAATAPAVTESPAPVAVLEGDPRLEPYRTAVSAAETRLARHRRVVAKVASLHAELEAATEKERELLEQVEAQSAVLDQAAENARHTVAHMQEVEAVPAAAPQPLVASSDIDEDQVEWYLLARLSAQRSLSYAGSVPLVLDETLLGLPTDEVRRLLDRLERMSESVQIVYLSDDRDVLDWANNAGIERAATVTAA